MAELKDILDSTEVDINVGNSTVRDGQLAPLVHNHDTAYDAIGSASVVQTNLDTHTADTTTHYPQSVISITESQVSDLDKYTTAEVDTAIATREAGLGNPTTDGDVLSSTIAGARTWVTPSSGGSGGQVDSVVSANTDAMTVDNTDPVNPSLTIVTVSPVTSTNSIVTEAELADAGGGDMLKSVYDANDSGVVDNAELVNGLAVGTAVPVGAVFTDTLYDDTALQGEVDTNTLDIEDNSTAIATKEAGLGNPTTDGDVLASTIAGVRSWVTPSSGGTGGQVDTIVAGANVQVDSADPVNPVVSATDTDTIYDDTAIQAEVDLNTAKVGITTAQADEITANTAKVSYTDAALVGTHTTDIAANTAALGTKLEVVPNATDTVVGGILVRLDAPTTTVYITTDGSAP